MGKINNFKILVYFLVLLVILSLSYIILYAVLPIGDAINDSDTYAINGEIDLSEYNFSNDIPVELIGEWDVYPGVYLDNMDVDYTKLQNSLVKELPIKKISEDSDYATYQLHIKVNFDEQSYQDKVIALPFVSDDIRVFVNGQYVEGVHSNEGWNAYLTQYTMYSLKETYDINAEYQEIIISTNSDVTNLSFYNKTATLSSAEKILSLEKIKYIIEGLLIGIVLATIFTCITYIITVPKFSVLTLMNIFDILLMIHILFNMSDLPRMIANAYSSDANIEFFIRRMDLSFLFLAGFCGNYLAKILYGNTKKYKLHEKVLNAAYFIFAIYLFLSADMNSIYIIIFGLVLVSLSFIDICRNYIKKIKSSEFKYYQTFHVTKTMYLGVIIIVDIITINSAQRPNAYILMAYSLFFIIHMAIRAYEYRIPYRKLATLNKSLESLVLERTSELIEANKVLTQMAEKDALTKIYNRLYFEESLSTQLELMKKGEVNTLHLCIFDLDNFKFINDNYGHASGDETLIETVEVVNKLINDEIIFSRVGGEEFTLLFTNCKDEYVLQVVENIRYSLDVLSQKEMRTTGSFGISKAQNSGSRKELFFSSDECLYASKRDGKNKITYNFNGEIKEYKN